MTEESDKPSMARTREPTASWDDDGVLSDIDPTEGEPPAATRRSPLRLAIIGMWLVFGPIFLWPIMCVAFSFDISSPIAAGVMLLLAAGIYLAVLCLAVMAYLRSPVADFGLCRHCGYRLFGLRDPRCPECGTPFDMEEVHEELEVAGSAPLPSPRPRWSRADLAYAIAVGLCYLPGLGAVVLAILRPEAETFLDDIFRVMPCVMQVAGVLLLLSGIRQAYSRRVTGYSRLFVVAIAANILLALGILWVLIATLCPLRP